ncbi:retinol dehydrogenase 12-like [Condylostylus longicornis]|uniref:retinol dehydrogenase 12-like n=1 Tax=Condylostylus longicornis TaxID=2530218 RepID=UPI00244DE42F|nr:retinol dehydrogenase 12-like [Condylostylus longicornis]
MSDGIEQFIVNFSNETTDTSPIITMGGEDNNNNGINGSLNENDNNDKAVLSAPAEWILIVIGIIVGFVIIVFIIRKIIQGPSYWKNNRIDDKVVIVTGCNTGIGKETVLELAKRGAKIYMACRDPIRCEAARLEIIEKTKNEKIFNRTLDLSSLDSVRKFADTFHKEENRLDILINNAGVMACPHMLTKDGFEMQIGTNHLAHFLLTNLLLDTIKASAPSRIVVVASGIYLWGRIKKDDLMSEKSYAKIEAYCQSKLANILFSKHLASKLEGTGVTVNCCHPGVVKTELGRHLIKNKTKAFLNPIASYFLKSPRAGAQTQLRLALDPSLEKTSGYFYLDCIRAPVLPKAKDKEMMEWLWNKSEELIESVQKNNNKMNIEEVNNKKETTMTLETADEIKEIKENTEENENIEVDKNKNGDAIVIEVTNEK